MMWGNEGYTVLTQCFWIAAPSGESDEEGQDSRPSIDFSDLDEDLDDYW